MGLTGPSGGSPIRVGAPVADYVGALQTTVAITVALANEPVPERVSGSTFRYWKAKSRCFRTTSRVFRHG